MCADFQYYLNRTGARGPQGYKGDKGDDGKTPVPRTGTNTPIETTVIFDTGDGNPYETPNLKYPIEDRGGNVVMLDRTNNTQYYGTPDQATDDSYGVVKLATPESVLDDPLDSDVVTYELFDDNNQAIKTTTDGLAGNITQLNTDLGAEVTNRTNADIQLTNKINTDVNNEATARSSADAALSGRIDNLTTSKADKSDVYTKTQTDSLLNNKSNVGHTHNYNDLTNKPTIGNGTITFKQGNTTVGTITTNQLSNSTLTFADPTGITPGPGLDLDGSTNMLSVKIDNDTLGINSDGEIEVQNAGTTYSEGNAIDLTNDEISVKYDNDTLKLNNSGQLYADIPTPATVDQTYDATSTNAQSGVAIAGAGFMNGSIVQSPLEYLPDTADNIILHNINNTTLIDTRNNGVFSNSGYNEPLIYNSTSGEYKSLYSNQSLINLNSLSYCELELTNGLNIGMPYQYSNDSIYIYIFGKYSLGSFVPLGYIRCFGTGSGLGIFTENQLTYYSRNTQYTECYFIPFYKPYNSPVAYLGCDKKGSSFSLETLNLTNEESTILDQTTHLRMMSMARNTTYGYSTINLNNIIITNPSPTNTIVTNGDAYARMINYENGDNLLDVHPESLSLKYDSTTLGVNASNELTVPTATTSNLGLVQPDGTTITINNGVISAASSAPIKKTITQASANVSESNGTVTVTDVDVTISTLVNLYPSDTTTESWLENNTTSTIITENNGSFTFEIDSSLPSTFSMYYIITEVQ